MAIDPTQVAATAAAKLKTTTEQVQPFTDAAFVYWLNYCSTDPTAPLTEFADDPLTEQGLVLSTMRLYQDSPNPSGGIDSFDGFASGGFVPSRLYSHHNQYFAPISKPVTTA